jgi:hypothetical protein
MLKIIAILLSFSVFFTSCVSSTVIRSKPLGADVYIDGVRVGKTPYQHQDSKIVGSRIDIELKKEGYETLNTYIYKDEEPNVGAIVGGFFFLFPFLWTMQYYPSHNYELVPTQDIEQSNENVIQNNSVPQKTTISSKADRIRELKKLVDEGLLTIEEFEKEKKKILEEDEN